MQHERYEMTRGHLVIVDPELEIGIQESFSLPFLPLSAKISSVSKDFEAVWNRDSQGALESACLKKDGLLHGQFLQFYPSGKLKGECFYREGKLYGLSSFFSEENTLLSATWFYDGVPVGKSRQYYRGGPLYSLQRYKKGKLHGKQEYFYEDSAIKSSLMYREGELHGGVELFWPNGQIKRRAFFAQGLREGEDFIWSESGILLDLGEYEKGKPIKKQQRRYANGVLKEESYYHQPNRVDRWKWNEQGQLIYEQIHLDEHAVQETTTKWPEGIVNIKKGTWDGDSIRWH